MAADLTTSGGELGRFCAECGSEAGPAAQFCRACGSPLDAGQAEHTWPASEDAATAQGTGSIASEDAVTAPVLDPPAAARADWPAAEQRPPAAAPPPARSESGSRAPIVAALAALAVIVLAGIGAGSYLLLSDDGDSEQSALDDWSYRPGDYASDPARDDGEDEAAATATESETAATLDADGGGSIEPELEAGDYLQLGSFRGDGATDEAARLAEHGIDAYVVDSDGVAELLPGFKVVVAGPLSGAAERRRILRAGERAGIGPLDKTLTPLTTAPLAADLAGTYDAALERTSPDPALERAIDATFVFAGDGRSGSVEYDSPRCSSELVFAGTDRGTLTYDETVTAGRCADGGTWSVKPSDGELRATWTEPDSDYFVSGDLVVR